MPSSVGCSNMLPLVKVTIVPEASPSERQYLPEERMIVRTEQMLDEMCAALGGRAAEKIMFDKISTGALSDWKKSPVKRGHGICIRFE